MSQNDGELPLEVRFAKWAKYQHTNATHYAKVETSILYDTRTRGSDGSTGRLLRGMLMALMGHGRVNVRAWIGQCWDKKGARRDIKSWIDNGLLETVPLQIDREIDREIEILDAVASSVPKPTRRQRQKPRPQADRKPSWLAPFAEVWDRGMGAGTFDYGRWARPLRDLVDAHNEAEVRSRLERYAADASLNGVRSPRHFQTNFAAYGATPTLRDSDDLIAASIRRKLAPGPQFKNAWDFAIASEDEKRVFKARGGAFAIWNSQERRPM